MLRCPKCHEKLEKCENVYRCSNSHSYDISSKGYVNLILANQKHSSDPGDDKESLASRKYFLDKGYYQKLAQAVTDLFDKYVDSNKVVLDAGCGTGYYLNYLMSNSKIDRDYFATDISKKGVQMTKSTCKRATCFVSSVFNLPLDDSCIDASMSIFCPYSSEEFSRVIKKGGYLIAVTAGKEHLYQLKEVVYEKPYYNDEKGYSLPDFELIEKFNVKYKMDLNEQKDIICLWKMMPYYHTSSLKDSEKLFEKTEIITTADFLVQVFQRR